MILIHQNCVYQKCNYSMYQNVDTISHCMSRKSFRTKNVIHIDTFFFLDGQDHFIIYGVLFLSQAVSRSVGTQGCCGTISYDKYPHADSFYIILISFPSFCHLLYHFSTAYIIFPPPTSTNLTRGRPALTSV